MLLSKFTNFLRFLKKKKTPAPKCRGIKVEIVQALAKATNQTTVTPILAFGSSRKRIGGATFAQLFPMANIAARSN